MLHLDLQLSTYPEIIISWRMSKPRRPKITFITISSIDITMIHYPIYNLKLQKHREYNHSDNTKR